MNHKVEEALYSFILIIICLIILFWTYLQMGGVELYNYTDYGYFPIIESFTNPIWQDWVILFMVLVNMIMIMHISKLREKLKKL